MAGGLRRPRPGASALIGTLLLPRPAVELLAHRPQGPARADGLAGHPQDVAEPEGELEARVVGAAFEVADRLVVDADGVGEPLTRQPMLGPEHGDPVVQRPTGRRVQTILP